MLKYRAICVAIFLVLLSNSDVVRAGADETGHDKQMRLGADLAGKARAKLAEAEALPAASEKGAPLRQEARALLMKAQAAFASALASVQKARAIKETRALEHAYVAGTSYERFVRLVTILIPSA